MTPAAGKNRPPASVPGDRIDELFGGPLEEFTARRNELAKELRAGGEADGAGWVKALRKPTRAAWIVNQLRARKRKDLDAVLERGAELRELQEGLLAGKVDRDRLRDAAQAEQRAISALMKTAEAIGREHGAGSQVIDRVAETLQAASSDPEVAEAIARGRVEREARATSLGLVGPATPAPGGGGAARTKERKEKRGAGPGKREAARAAKAAQRERETRREAAKRRRAAERALAAAERRIERERGVADRLRGELADRERSIAEAEAEAERARAELEELD